MRRRSSVDHNTFPGIMKNYTRVCETLNIFSMNTRKNIFFIVNRAQKQHTKMRRCAFFGLRAPRYFFSSSSTFRVAAKTLRLNSKRQYILISAHTPHTSNFCCECSSFESFVVCVLEKKC